MSSACDSDFVPLISSIPGPRGATGAAGSAGAAATAGRNAFTLTTSPFIMPAASAAVTVTVQDTSWMAQGQSVFVESAGQFLVSTLLSGTSVSLTAQNVPTNAAATTVIATGKRVTPGGIAYIDSAALTNLTTRVTALEESPGGIRSFFGSTAPTGPGLRIGDVWYETTGGGATVVAQWRWDGTGWVRANVVLSLADFGTGLRPIVRVNSLTGAGAVGEFVLLTTDNKLYRGTGTGWTRALATGDLVGQVDASTLIVDGTVLAQHLGAESVTADAVGANRIITLAANIGDAVINDAHITSLSAGKITAGDMQSVNIGYAGRIFHPSYPTHKFRSIDFGTSFADGKVFASGNCLSTSYAHATPVTAYCPGNAGWTSNGLTACPDGDGKARVQVQARLIAGAGNCLIYGQVNNGTPFPLAARASTDGTDAVVDTMRIITGVGPADIVKIYAAPADAAGVVSPKTCRYEIDATFFNW